MTTSDPRSSQVVTTPGPEASPPPGDEGVGGPPTPQGEGDLRPPPLSPWRVIDEFLWTMGRAVKRKGLGLEALTFHPDGGEGVGLPSPDLEEGLKELARRYPHIRFLEVRVAGEPIFSLGPKNVLELLRVRWERKRRERRSEAVDF